MSKTTGPAPSKPLFADLGTEYVKAHRGQYQARLSPADFAAAHTLRFDRGGGSLREGDILYFKGGGFFRIALLEEYWHEPSHEQFEIEYLLAHCVPVIPEDRLERRGRGYRLAPIYDHAVAERPRRAWRKENGARLSAEAEPVLTSREHASQTFDARLTQAATYAAVSASSVFSFAAAALLVRCFC